ncbi:MAG: acetolactate synthase [Phycisphaerae bacterium]|nr:acetolactate synthase [Phycisphaerae bacterium]HBZ96369.1 acetolactate synthase [Phycisphaerales bacterium]
MSQLPQETQQGYDAPMVRQFSIFLENRVGRLLDILRMFDEAEGITIHGLAVMESSDCAVVRLIPDDSDATRAMLRASEYSFAETELLVVQLTDERPLSMLCLYLLGAELNIDFMYPMLTASYAGDGGRIAMAVDDTTFAGQILRRKGFVLYGSSEL